MSIIRRAVAPLIEARNSNNSIGYQSWGDSTPPSNGMLGGSVAGTTMSEQNALQIAAVWGSVNLIADAIATLPIKQYRKLGKTKTEMPNLAQVIARPYSEYTRREFIHAGTVSLLLRGNFFGKIIGRDPDTLLPSQVQPVHPDAARVTRLLNGTVETRYFGQVVNPENVTIARALMVPGAVVGLNPIQFLKNSFGQARAQDLHNNAFFANNASPGGFISVEGDLPEEEVLAMARAYMQNHQGPGSAYMPGIFTNNAKWNQVSLNLDDAQFLEQMQWSAQVISGLIYRVPPHMLGMTDRDTSWGAGIEQQELGFVRNTLAIWLERWEDLMSSWLPAGQFVKFDIKHRLRGDALQRASYYQIMQSIHALNGAEIREMEDYPAVTDPEAKAILTSYNQPLASNVKAISSSGAGPGGDKANAHDMLPELRRAAVEQGLRDMLAEMDAREPVKAQ